MIGWFRRAKGVKSITCSEVNTAEYYRAKLLNTLKIHIKFLYYLNPGGDFCRFLLKEFLCCGYG